MSRNLVRRYQLRYDGNSNGIMPALTDDAVKIIEVVADQVFYRTKMFTFFLQGGAYDAIVNADIETEFFIYMQQKIDNVWVDEWIGKFYKTDCSKINPDKYSLEVNATTVDSYTTLLPALKKEFNVVDLNPAITPLTVKRQPIIQIYIAGESYLTNFVGTNHWEQEVLVQETSSTVLEDTYFFAQCLILDYVPGHDLDPSGVEGVYTWTGSQYVSVVGNFAIFWSGINNRWLIVEDVSDIRYEGTIGEVSAAATIFEPVSGQGTNTQLHEKIIYARILSNAATIDGTPTNAVPVDDIIPFNSNYTTVLGLDTQNFIPSSNLTAAPGKYGKADESCENVDDPDLYFNKPGSGIPTDEGVYPVNRSSWDCFAIWFHFDDDIRTIQTDASEEITINNAYKIDDVIRAFLTEIDSSISYLSDTDHSQFYHDAVNPIDSSNLTFFLVPIQNVLVGQFDKAVLNTTTSLERIFNLKKFTHRVDWHVDDDKRLRFEHRRFYRNGMNYTTPNVGINITDFVDPYSGKAWDYFQNVYDYDKERLPERIVTKFNSEASAIFDGFPIEIISPYVNEGDVKEETITDFMTDIDFALINSSDVNQRGFFFLAAALESGEYKVQFLELIVNSETHKMQNGHLSALYLHDTFFRDDLPATNVKINDEVTTATSVKRAINSNLQFNAALDFDPMTLIEVSRGAGKIKTISESIRTGEQKISIKHDTQ